MASGIASTTRFIGIIVGLAGLGAVLAAVAENTLRTLGTQTIAGQSLDWHALNLRIVGGDAVGALSALPESVQMSLQPAVHGSVTAGFGIIFAIAAVIAAASSILTWILVRSPQAQAAMADAEISTALAAVTEAKAEKSPR